MDANTIILGVNGVLLTIIGYFLVQTMNKLNTTSDKADKATNDIILLKQSTESALTLHKQETVFQNERLEEKIDELKDSIITLTKEIKVLNKHNG